MKNGNFYGRLISHGAVTGLAGFILSGPVAFLVVHFINPQPEWTSAAVFAKNYSIVQDLPYYFGFLLIAGMLMLSAGLYLDYRKEIKTSKFQLLLAFGLTVIFAALILFNYICQTTFVHNLATNYKPEYDSSISTFSMSNPLSFCWANEMWGYAILGIATMLMAGYYADKNRLIYFLLIVNGYMSISSAVWTIIDVHWVMTVTGLALYFAWNILMITVMTLIYFQSKK